MILLRARWCANVGFQEWTSRGRWLPSSRSMLSDKAASIVSKSWKSKATSVRLLRFTMSSVSIAFVLVLNGIAMSAKTPTSLKKALSYRVLAILLFEKRRSDDPGFRGCRKVDQVDQESLVKFGPDRRKFAEKVLEGVPKMKSVRVVEAVPQMKSFVSCSNVRRRSWWSRSTDEKSFVETRSSGEGVGRDEKIPLHEKQEDCSARQELKSPLDKNIRSRKSNQNRRNPSRLQSWRWKMRRLKSMTRMRLSLTLAWLWKILRHKFAASQRCWTTSRIFKLSMTISSNDIESGVKAWIRAKCEKFGDGWTFRERWVLLLIFWFFWVWHVVLGGSLNSGCGEDRATFNRSLVFFVFCVFVRWVNRCLSNFGFLELQGVLPLTQVISI